MNLKIILSLFFLVISFSIYSQQIPESPNAYDENGNKHGRWTYIYSPSWRITEDPDSITYYRLITYKHGVPKGLVRDYYSSGFLQWQGKLLSESPKKVMDGLCIWYFENGEKKRETEYKKGKMNGKYKSWHNNKKLAIEGQYKNDHHEGVWFIWNEQGILSRSKNFITGEGLTGSELGRRLLISYDIGDYNKAIFWGEKAKQQLLIEFGNNHPYYISNLNNLAGIYQHLGLFEKAEFLYQESLRCWAEVLGEDHPDYASGLNNLAELYKKMGLYKKAESLLLESLQIQSNPQNKNQSNYAISLNNLAALYQIIESYKKAESLFLDSQQIILEVTGDQHPHYAASLGNLARLYAKKELYAKAERLFLESQEIILKTLGKQHPYYNVNLEQSANLYNNMGYFQIAKSKYTESAKSKIIQLKKLYPSLSEVEKIQFLKNKIEFHFQNYYSFTINHSDTFPELLSVSADLNLSSKGLAISTFVNIRQRILQSQDSTLLKLYDHWLSQRQK